MRKAFWMTVYIFFAVLVVWSVLNFRIRGVSCKSQYGMCSSNIENQLKNVLGKRTLLTKKELDKVLIDGKLVDDYSVSFKSPSILIINVLEKKPVYSIFSNKTDKYYLMDDTGVIILINDNSAIPYIVGDYGNYSVGDRVEEEVLFMAKLYEKICALYEIEAATHKEDEFIIKVRNGPYLILPIYGDTNVLAGSVRVVVEKIYSDNEKNIIEKNPDQITIDFRFSNPVIR